MCKFKSELNCYSPLYKGLGLNQVLKLLKFDIKTKAGIFKQVPAYIIFERFFQ
jgi:hypothetical protein